MLHILKILFLCGIFLSVPCLSTECLAEDKTGITLAKAQICEEVKQGECLFPNKIISFSKGKIYCYTVFDSVNNPSIVYHKWYHRDELVVTHTLKIKSSYHVATSSMQIREKDKGPWRIEIANED
ncbi:MAG: DUF2914 domain-containing protein, partial [Desulfatiglandales bacterium]